MKLEQQCYILFILPGFAIPYHVWGICVDLYNIAWDYVNIKHIFILILSISYEYFTSDKKLYLTNNNWNELSFSHNQLCTYALLLVSQWLDCWCASFAAQVRFWRSRLSWLITRNYSCGQPSTFNQELHAYNYVTKILL